MAYDPLRQLRQLPEPWPRLEPGSVSWWVRLLRRVLARHGYGDQAWCNPQHKPSPADEYDAELEEIVTEFQHDHGLESDGLVGRETWQSLGQVPLAKAGELDGCLRPPAPEDELRIRELIVNYARLLEALDVREQGANRGEVVEAFQRHATGQVGYAWCVAFCDFVVEQAYAALGLRMPIDIGVSSSGLVRKARGRARLKLETGAAQPGDIMVLKGGPTGYRHTGIVIALQPDGCLRTVEGNTNLAGSAEGDGLYLRTRDPQATPMVFVDVSA